LNTGDEVIIAKQSYRLYRELSKMMGAKVIEIPLTADYQFDLAKFAAAITAKTKLIWLCNPNNPTGTLTSKKEIEKLIALLPEHVQLIVDEAYADFSDPQQLPDLIKDLKVGKKIVIVRTFSKFYGLAGARLGYAIANANTIQAYNTVTEPFCTSRTVLAGGYASITADQAAVQTARQQIIEQRAWLQEELAELGCSSTASQANFLFTKLPIAATELCRSMMKNGVIVRDCTPWGYPDHIRITVGKKAENQIFLQGFRTLLQKELLKRKANNLVQANEAAF
jgi:histidinol-phosphate aminotransferase